MNGLSLLPEFVVGKNFARIVGVGPLGHISTPVIFIKGGMAQRIGFGNQPVHSVIPIGGFMAQRIGFFDLASASIVFITPNLSVSVAVGHHLSIRVIGEFLVHPIGEYVLNDPVK